MSYLEKVEAERDELSDKIKKLDRYLEGEEKVSDAHRRACNRQLNAMLQYRTALNHRISYMRMKKAEDTAEDTSTDFDANAAVDCNIEDIVVEGRTQEQLEAMRDAEKSGQNRKGAIERLEEAMSSGDE